MSHNEDELRRRLKDPRWALPEWEDPEGRIALAARRFQRVRAAGIAGALLVIFAAAAGVAGLTRPTQQINVIAPTPSSLQGTTATAPPTPSPSPSSPRPTAGPSPTGSAPRPVASGSSVASNGATGRPLPASFSAASVSFVSLQTGWLLGATCPVCEAFLLRTSDAGQSWTPVAIPSLGLARGASNAGVGKVRFADVNNGWLYGPELWATHDGGAQWARASLPGVTSQAVVSDLAAANGAVHAALIGGPTVQIETSPVGRNAWQLSPTTIPTGAGPVAQAQIVLHGPTGWIIENDRLVIGGARLVAGLWQPWQPPCTTVGGPATLDASSASNLVAVCHEGVWTGTAVSVRLYLSSDAGSTFRPAAQAVPLTSPDTAGTASPATILVGGGVSADTRPVLVGSFDGGANWSVVYRGPAGGSGWSDLGFSDAKQGVVVQREAGTQAGTLVMTFDGGHTWKRQPS